MRIRFCPFVELSVNANKFHYTALLFGVNSFAVNIFVSKMKQGKWNFGVHFRGFVHTFSVAKEA